MGQARKRGTFEERQAAAIARNDALSKQLETLPAVHPLRQVARKHGTQRLAVSMLALGMLAALTSKE